MGKHSKTPWIVSAPDEPYENIEIKSGERLICSIVQDDAPVEDYNAEQWANAKHIVRCVNSHEQLVSALKIALGVIAANAIDDYDNATRTIQNVLKGVGAE